MSADQPVDIALDHCGGNCPVQAEGTFNGYHFYFRARGDCWTIDVGIPKGALGWYDSSAWSYEEEYAGPEKDAGWMAPNEAKVFIDKAAKQWHADQGWLASDKLRDELAAEYAARNKED